MDAGQSTFYYKVRDDAGILMDVQVVPVGEKQTPYSGRSPATRAPRTRSARRAGLQAEHVDVHKDVKDIPRKTAPSVESAEIAYAEAVVARSTTTSRSPADRARRLASDLAETVVSDRLRPSARTSETVQASGQDGPGLHEGRRERPARQGQLGREGQEGHPGRAQAHHDPVGRQDPRPRLAHPPRQGLAARRRGVGRRPVRRDGQGRLRGTRIDQGRRSRTRPRRRHADTVTSRRHDRSETTRKLREDYQSHDQGRLGAPPRPSVTTVGQGLPRGDHAATR